MTRKYFGTDGIRGTVGQGTMTPEFVLQLAKAAGVVLTRHANGRRPKVLIGKDTRVSGYLLESCLEAGLISVGVDVVMVGPMPTAAVAYLTRAQKLSAGIVISASHNPYPDNGIKFFSGAGTKLPDEWEMEIEQEIEKEIACNSSEKLGKATRLSDAAGRYIEFCKSTFPRDKHLGGLRIVLDCANGAAYHIAPSVFKELGADVIVMADKPDGLNINRGVGATHPEGLAKAVVDERADYGFALDGDADRLICVDGTGRIYNGDELLYAIVRERLLRPAGVAGVVGTLMTNLGLELALKALDVALVRAKVGDRYVFEQLQAKGWFLGGESSGHILVLDRHSTGDGIVSAMQVLRAVRVLDKPLADILEPVNMLPQVLKNVRLAAGYDWAADSALQEKIHHVESTLGETGRLLIRPSGTEPVLRVMAEALETKIAEQAVDAVLAAIPSA